MGGYLGLPEHHVDGVPWSQHRLNKADLGQAQDLSPEMDERWRRIIRGMQKGTVETAPNPPSRPVPDNDAGYVPISYDWEAMNPPATPPSVQTGVPTGIGTPPTPVMPILPPTSVTTASQALTGAMPSLRGARPDAVPSKGTRVPPGLSWWERLTY